MAVIIVTRNSAHCLAVCLASTLASDYGSLRVVVVDNASTDATRPLLESRFPTVELVSLSVNLGFAAANNIGLRRVVDTSEYVFLVNPDTRMPPSLVRNLVELMQCVPNIGVVGPLQYEYSQDGPHCAGQPNAWSRYMLERLGEHEFVDQVPELSGYGDALPDDDGLTDVAFIQGSALFLRLCTLARTGLFDETFFCFYEEVDLCRRTRWAGYRVCLAVDLGIEHLGGASTNADFLRVRLMMRNRYYYALTDPRLDSQVLRILLIKFAREDLGLRRSRRPARLLAFGLSCAWLLISMPKLLANRAAYGMLAGTAQRN